jgi:Zn-finger nucleic acid-binding protein
MFCPNDSIQLHQVTIESHYGLPVAVDQCQRCGGIWFDALALYKIKQGEAERIEALELDALWTPSTMSNLKLICPRDQAELF